MHFLLESRLDLGINKDIQKQMKGDVAFKVSCFRARFSFGFDLKEERGVSWKQDSIEVLVGHQMAIHM